MWRWSARREISWLCYLRRFNPWTLFWTFCLKCPVVGLAFIFQSLFNPISLFFFARRRGGILKIYITSMSSLLLHQCWFVCLFLAGQWHQELSLLSHTFSPRCKYNVCFYTSGYHEFMIYSAWYKINGRKKHERALWKTVAHQMSL